MADDTFLFIFAWNSKNSVQRLHLRRNEECPGKRLCERLHRWKRCRNEDTYKLRHINVNGKQHRFATQGLWLHLKQNPQTKLFATHLVAVLRHCKTSYLVCGAAGAWIWIKLVGQDITKRFKNRLQTAVALRWPAERGNYARAALLATNATAIGRHVTVNLDQRLRICYTGRRRWLSRSVYHSNIRIFAFEWVCACALVCVSRFVRCRCYGFRCHLHTLWDGKNANALVAHLSLGCFVS